MKRLKNNKLTNMEYEKIKAWIGFYGSMILCACVEDRFVKTGFIIVAFIWGVKWLLLESKQ